MAKEYWSHQRIEINTVQTFYSQKKNVGIKHTHTISDHP